MRRKFMREKIYEIIINSVKSMNESLEIKIPVDKGESCELYGKSGVLDSLALVSLIVIVEENLEEHFNTTVILASDKALSQKRSPFATIGSLVDQATALLKENSHVE
jgi:hypothetical protein